MYVVVPVKFDDCVVNIAGTLSYTQHRNRISSSEALRGALAQNYQNIKDLISRPYILNISAQYIFVDLLPSHQQAEWRQDRSTGH